MHSIDIFSGAIPCDFSLYLVFLDSSSNLVIFHWNLVIFCEVCVWRKWVVFSSFSAFSNPLAIDYVIVFQPFRCNGTYRKCLRCSWNPMQWSRCLYCYNWIELWLGMSPRQFRSVSAEPQAATPGTAVGKHWITWIVAWRFAFCTNSQRTSVLKFEFPVVFTSMLFIAAMLAMTVFSFLRKNTAVEKINWNVGLIGIKLSSVVSAIEKSLKIVDMGFSRVEHDPF